MSRISLLIGALGLTFSTPAHKVSVHNRKVHHSFRIIACHPHNARSTKAAAQKGQQFYRCAKLRYLCRFWSQPAGFADISTADDILFADVHFTDIAADTIGGWHILVLEGIMPATTKYEATLILDWQDQS
jgi:hypothetical protein